MPWTLILRAGDAPQLRLKSRSSSRVAVLLGMTLDSVLWLTWMHRHPEQYP